MSGGGLDPPGNVVSAPIFISYSSSDETIAETICNALEARGLSCWISGRDIGGGKNFQELIPKAIRAARVMLLVFSSSANNSKEIKKEIALAGRYHLTVVPVRVEDVAPGDAFAYEFSTRQWIDLFKDWEREIERLAAQLRTTLVETTPHSGPKTEPPANPVRPAAAPAPAKRSPMGVPGRVGCAGRSGGLRRRCLRLHAPARVTTVRVRTGHSHCARLHRHKRIVSSGRSVNCCSHAVDRPADIDSAGSACTSERERERRECLD